MYLSYLFIDLHLFTERIPQCEVVCVFKQQTSMMITDVASISFFLFLYNLTLASFIMQVNLIKEGRSWIGGTVRTCLFPFGIL